MMDLKFLLDVTSGWFLFATEVFILCDHRSVITHNDAALQKFYLEAIWLF